MKKLNSFSLIAGMLLLFAIGLFTVFAPVPLGAEELARPQAVNVPITKGSVGGVSEATVVNLADVEFKPIASMSEREIRFKASSAERLALQEKARNMGPQNVLQRWDSYHQDSYQVQQAAAPTVSSSFDALDVSDCCGGGTSVPPDSDIAAGLIHLVAVENSSFEIYDKTGAVVVSSVLLDNLFSGVTGCSNLFDPTVIYDSEEDHFLIGADASPYFCLAVSQTGDPTGQWNLYSFDALFYGDEFFDYPHMGVGDHAIFMGANMFNGSVPEGFEGRMYAMDKNAAYAGTAMSWRSASASNDGNTPLPLNLTGFPQGTVPQPFDTHFFISDLNDGTTAWLWAWPDALGAGVPTVVQTYDLNTLTSFTAGLPVDAPQGGSTDLIQANDWRFRSFEYRNGQGWTTDTISGDVGNGAVDFERIFTMDLSTPPYASIYASVAGWGDSSVIYPDLAVDHCGNVALGHERSDSTRFPSIEVGGMANGYGGLEMPTMIKAGEVTYYSFDVSPLRWGDYSGMVIDPDGKTFWYIGEYAKDISGYGANYGNYITQLTYDCVMVYTITYNGNTNTGGDVPVDGNDYSNGDTVSVLDNSGNLVKTGYTFNGWNTAADGSGTPYSSNATFTIGSSSVFLYAQWSLSYTLKVMIESYGQSQGKGSVTSSPAGIDCGNDCLEAYDYNTAVTLTASPETGSIFVNWSGDNDCSDGIVTMTTDVTCTAFFYHFPWPMFMPAIIGEIEK